MFLKSGKKIPHVLYVKIHEDHSYHFFAYFFSLLGDSLFKIAFPLFVYAKTDSSIYTSLSYATQYAPYILIMPFMGGIVDRMSEEETLALYGCSFNFVYVYARPL